MDSPVSPVLLNFFIRYFEESQLVMTGDDRSSVGDVDDSFTMFDSKETALILLYFLNSRHKSIS